ncbi:MAG: hypothetical protein Q8J88_17280 [Bacteroidales bacterium]|nr:hypothetical protein [Bacteroidales bacterium]
MTNSVKYILAVLFFIAFSSNIKAQQSVESSGRSDSKNSLSSWIISASGGTSIFFGDVKQNPVLPVTTNRSELRYVADIGLERRFSASFAARFQAAYSHVVGTRRISDIHFQSFVYEANATALFYPINLISGYDTKLFADFYIVLGGGIASYNAKLYQLSTGNELASAGYGNGNGIGGTQMDAFLLGGIGLDIPLSPNLSIRFETANRALATDNFDLKADGFKYDIYNYTTLGLKYSFGKRPGSIRNLPEVPKTQIPEKEADTVKKVIDDSWLLLNKVIEADPVEKEVVVEKVVVDTTDFEKETVVKTVTEIPPASAIKDAEYRVQILANGKKAADITALAKRFKMDAAEIKQDMYNGMFIYTVGSFATYNEAARSRNIVRDENGVTDAFIVYFENGQRQAAFPKTR